jgi:membrane dipeptidase
MLLRAYSVLLASFFLLVHAAVIAQTAAGPEQQARELVKRYPLVDGHIDVPFRSYAQWLDVSVSQAGRDFDYPRAVAGGLNAPFMSIYTPADAETAGTAYALANQLIDLVEAMVQRSPQKFAMATSVADVREQFREGTVSLALGMENGAPIEGSLEKLEHFYHRGIRYITLAHSKSNHISDSSYDKERPWQGLSPFGLEVVKAMNQLGIIIDVSHLSDKAIASVLENSSAPVIASHSSVRHFTPDFERNMNDELIRGLAANGGVIMINFGSGFVTAEAQVYGAKFKADMKVWAEQSKAGYRSDEWNAYVATYREKRPYPFATMSIVADHIDHVVKLVGVDYVGLGSDFDGVGDTLPVGLKDVSAYPNLVAELLRRGYSEPDIEKILGANLLRVWSQVEKQAASAAL